MRALLHSALCGLRVGHVLFSVCGTWQLVVLPGVPPPCWQACSPNTTPANPCLHACLLNLGVHGQLQAWPCRLTIEEEAPLLLKPSCELCALGKIVVSCGVQGWGRRGAGAWTCGFLVLIPMIKSAWCRFTTPPWHAHAHGMQLQQSLSHPRTCDAKGRLNRCGRRRRGHIACC